MWKYNESHYFVSFPWSKDFYNIVPLTRSISLKPRNLYEDLFNLIQLLVTVAIVQAFSEQNPKTRWEKV